MLILAEKWAQEYMSIHQNISIYVDGGGTATGFQALIEGGADICTASRNLKSEEAKKLAQRYGNIGISHLVAKDALSIYTNAENSIDDLTTKQLMQIFTGKIRNWNTVGGDEAPINVLIRPPNSGTHCFFKEHILEGREYSEQATVVPTTTEIVSHIREDKFAIGYGGLAYGADIRHCRVNGIHPSQENVQYDLYPISRYLYFYTVKKPRGIINQFINWVMSPEGQKIVTEVGFIPLWGE